MKTETPTASASPSWRPRWLGVLVTTAFAVLLGYFLYHYREDWRLLRGISAAQALGLIALVVLGIAVNGLKLRRILDAHGIRLQAKEGFGLASISFALNCLLFKSGSLTVSNHLKRRHGFSYSRFIGTLGADHLIILFINALTAGVASLYLSLQLGQPFGWAAAVFFVIATLLFLMKRRTFRFTPGRSRLSQALSQALDSLDRLLKNRPLFQTLCAYNVTLVLAGALRLYLACSVVGVNTGLVACILFSTAMVFVRVLPLLQSDLGSRELAVGFLANLIGTGFQAGLVATVVDRLFEWLTAFVLAFCFRNLLLVPRQPAPQDGTPPIPSARP